MLSAPNLRLRAQRSGETSPEPWRRRAGSSLRLPRDLVGAGAL